MDDYKETRNEIKRLISKTIKSEIVKDTFVKETKPLDELIENRAETIIGNYENLVHNYMLEEQIVKHKPRFFYGVFQSVLGSFLALLFIAIFALIIHGSKINPFDILKSETNANVEIKFNQQNHQTDSSGQK